MKQEATNALPRLDGDLVLGDRLGGGSGGSVWAARQVSLDRPVAVKRLHALAGSEARFRFGQEATLMARVAHPGIVPVLLHGTLDGDPVLVLERVDGRDLGRVIAALRIRAEGPSRTAYRTILKVGPEVGPTGNAPWWRTATALIIEVARALEHAHRSGVLHRDVKPANILVTREMTPRLADFGGAVLDDGPSTSASSGSLAYAAPEILSGNRATRSSDVYSLGVTLFELLTLERPFDAVNAAALTHKVTTHQVPRVRRGVPRDLEVVVRTALARDPDQRYSSAIALARDLEAVMTRQPIVAQQEGRMRQMARTFQRHRGQVLLATMCTLLVVGALAAVQWQRIRSAEAIRKAGFLSDRHLEITLSILGSTLGQTAHAGMEEHPLMARMRADLIRIAIDGTRTIEGDEAASTEAFIEQVRSVRLDLRLKLLDLQRGLGRYDEFAAGLIEARGLLQSVPAEEQALARERLAYQTFIHAYTTGRQAAAVPLGIAALELTAGPGPRERWWALRPGIWSTLTEAAIAERDLDVALERAEAGVLEARSELEDRPPKQTLRARRELARILTSLGAVHIERGSLALAEEVGEECLELLAECDSLSEVARMRAIVWNNLSLISRKRKDYEGALVWLHEALRAQDAEVKASPDSLYLRFTAARTREALARTLGTLGRFDEELFDTLDQCLATTRSLCAASPDSWQYHSLLARALEMSVVASIRRNDLAAAQIAIQAALAAGARCEELVPGSYSKTEIDRGIRRRHAQLTVALSPHLEGHSILTDYVEHYGNNHNDMRLAAGLMGFLAMRAGGDRAMAIEARNNLFESRRELALNYLEHAVDLGFHDYASIDAEVAQRKGLGVLQTMPAFVALMERMRSR